MTLTRLRFAALATATIAASYSAHGGLLDASDPACSIEVATHFAPSVFDGGTSDFSLLCWVRRTSWQSGQYGNVLDGGSVFRVGFDDLSDGILVRMCGQPQDISVLVPLRDQGPQQKVPVDEWMLIATSWDAAEQRLTAWAQSETVARVSATAADAQWSGDMPWPITLGQVGADSGFTGQLGLTVLRDHQIDEADLDFIWNGGQPHYFSPVFPEIGNLTGYDGVAWMIGHGIVTYPGKSVNVSGTGAQLGSTVTVNNVLVYNDRDLSGFFDVGRLDAVNGQWTMQSPHAVGEPWSDFFVRELPDLGISGDHYSELYAPKTRQMADGVPEGHLRVIASANSRGIRLNKPFYGGGFESWAFGGVYRARKSIVAGSIIPAASIWGDWPPWPGFRGLARKIGDVRVTESTSSPSIAFGNYTTFERNMANPFFPQYPFTGNAAVLEDGASFIPKARPEPGTRFDSKLDPLTVRMLLLKFPGSGQVIHQGEKAETQQTTNVTPHGDPIIETLDTTVVTHAMTPNDWFSATAKLLILDGTLSGIEPGDGCFIGSGQGHDGISIVIDVDTSSGVNTVITLEKWFPADPDTISSVLHFGPVEPYWITHEWPGLDASDPQIYRGINVTASGGIVVGLLVECFNPEADGLIVGLSGKSAMGYQGQLILSFSEYGIKFIEALQPDIWLMFFANHDPSAHPMAPYADAIRQVSPNTEIWWCGDPDFDIDVPDYYGTDGWQQWILDNAAANGVGAIVAHEHPGIGTGAERAADGQTSDLQHLSARGNELFLEAVLEMMQTAALTDPPPCLGDVTGDGLVDVQDLLEVLAFWGPCPPPCPADVDESGAVDVLDLLQVLGDWGPCP